MQFRYGVVMVLVFILLYYLWACNNSLSIALPCYVMRNNSDAYRDAISVVWTFTRGLLCRRTVKMS